MLNRLNLLEKYLKRLTSPFNKELEVGEVTNSKSLPTEKQINFGEKLWQNQFHVKFLPFFQIKVMQRSDSVLAEQFEFGKKSLSRFGIPLVTFEWM